jgi:uncharacterized membrane protein
MKRSSSQLKLLARTSMAGHYSVLVSSVLLFFIVTLMLESIPGVIIGNGRTIGGLALQSVITLIISLLTSVISVGLIRIALSVIRRQPYGIGDLFYAFSHHPDRFIIVAFIRALVSTVCQLPSFFFGSSFFRHASGNIFSWQVLLPNLLWTLAGTFLSTVVLLALALANTLMIDHDDLSAMEALRESGRLMHGNKGRLFYIDLSFLGLIFLSVFTCYIGMLWVYPYMIMTEAYFYLDVIGELDGTGTSQNGYDAYGYDGDFYRNNASYGGPSSYDGSRHTYPHGDRHASDYIEYPEDTYHVSSDRSSDEERN